jgi:transposase-like protein
LIELATRQVYLAGITANPTGEWATQRAQQIIETFVERTEPIRHPQDAPAMSRPRKYPNELRQRAVRLVFESKRPIAHIAQDLGIHKESLRNWAL